MRLSRFVTRRAIYRPLGNDNVPVVKVGNAMVARLVLLLFVYTMKNRFWVVEQPAGSLLEQHPRFAWLCSIMPIYRVRIRLEKYGVEREPKRATVRGTIRHTVVPRGRNPSGKKSCG